MTYWQAVRRVSAWEFRRFLKPRELMMTVIVIAALGIGGPIVLDLIRGESQVELALVGGSAGLDDGERFTFVPMSETDALAALEAGDVDGVLEIADGEAAELTVKRERDWTGELQAQLTQAFLPARLEEAGVSASQLGEVTRPASMEVVVVGSDQGLGGAALVSILLGVMIFAIFMGTGLLFTAITGEKTQRVTELVISAVPPQAWIDGKVLGTIGYMVVYLATYGVGLGIATVGSLLLAEGALPPLPPLVVDPVVVLAILGLIVAGTVLYLFLFAAIAASIDDPATSQRSGIIMLPGMFIAVGWFGLIGDPGNPLFAFLSYFPLTSSSAMSVRMILGDAGALEAVLALAILVATCFAARWAAGKVFSLAVLITGKEPTWGEMVRWLRRTG